MNEISSDRYDPSFWVRSQVQELGVRLADERTKPCPHLTDPDHDRYAWAVWAPAAIVCGECVLPILEQPPGVCDRCGEEPAVQQFDYEPTDGGDWLLLFRLCQGCTAREMATP